jgi:hypothetical protein
MILKVVKAIIRNVLCGAKWQYRSNLGHNIEAITLDLHEAATFVAASFILVKVVFGLWQSGNPFQK